MTTEIDAPRSRRTLLTAALGAGAVAIAGAIGRPAAIRAADGNPVIVGGEYTASSVTQFDTEGTGAVAVQGQGLTGIGVKGVSNSAYGIYGSSKTASGVFGTSQQGVAVYGTSPVVGVRADSDGIALDVHGKAKFTRSGKATIAANAKYVDVTVPGGLAAGSVIHATMQTYRTGVAIAAARPNYPTAGKVRIYLTKVGSTTSTTSVGWFVAEH